MGINVTKLLPLIGDAENLFKTNNELKKAWDDIVHGGKEKYGSLYLKDQKGVAWKVKVRWRGDRRHYIKLETIHEEPEQEFRAAVGKKHIKEPWRYKELAPEEWKVLAITATGEEEWNNLLLGSEYTEACTEVLNKLVYERELEPEKD